MWRKLSLLGSRLNEKMISCQQFIKYHKYSCFSHALVSAGGSLLGKDLSMPIDETIRF
jgi:hypothetical protein